MKVSIEELIGHLIQTDVEQPQLGTAHSVLHIWPQ